MGAGMSALIEPRSLRLARVQDRMAFSNDAPWTINPRTGFLETRAPLTWTGVRPYVRPYVQPDGSAIRVLRRPEQVEAPKHLARLRNLTATHGHPKGDVNVSPANVDALKVGHTGDEIRVDTIDGYRCPTARVVAQRQSTIDSIVAGATQSSLGYTALWVDPPAEERTTDPLGKPCGVWQGPRGPEYYDLEHILDPDCELVQQLVADGFDPEELGANHFAIALARGRGGVQSELMRVVDSIDIPLPSLVRGLHHAGHEGGEQEERARQSEGEREREGNGSPKIEIEVEIEPANDAPPKWTVGASRDLPFAPSETAWDGDAAAASVFDWAGFNADPPAPDSAKARQAFLVYDAAAPELKGSYKLPIARVDAGALRVVKAGLDAAASYLSQTDIPRDVADRARTVLDSYYTKFAELHPARDADPTTTEPRTMSAPKHTINLALSRDLASWAAKHNLPVPKAIGFAVARDEVDVEAIMSYCAGIEELCASMREALGMAEQAMSDAGVDKAALEEAVKAKEAKLAAAQEALASTADAMQRACDAAVSERDTLRVERDSLLAEVAPLRTAELDRVRAIAVKAGVAKDEVDKLATLAEVRRATVLARCPAQKAQLAAASDDAIGLVYNVVTLGIGGTAGGASPAAPTPTAPMPSPELAPARDTGNEAPRSATASALSMLAGQRQPNQPAN